MPAVRQAVLLLAWYTADSIRDSIRTKKKRFAGPYLEPAVNIGLTHFFQI